MVINFSNVTGRMKNKLVVEDGGVVYLSYSDAKNYYDYNMYYDEEYKQIVSSSYDKLVVMPLNKNEITVNGESKKVKAGAKEINGVKYIPLSEIEDVYNIKVNQVDNKVTVESLDKELKVGNVDKISDLKLKATTFSRTVEKIPAGTKVYIDLGNNVKAGWLRIRTERGNLGYIQEKNVKDLKYERDNKVYEPQIKGKISLAWEYFSEYAEAPDNSGKKYDGVNVVSPSFFYLSIKDTSKEGAKPRTPEEQAEVMTNIGESGEEYIKWAKSNGYKIWPKFSNETLSTTIDEFSTIINDYELRKSMIDEIVKYVKKYNLDGINLDFEYMYEDDKDSFSRFVIELAPQLRAANACLSVDVTAPDGGSSWSLCYDRNLIGEVADYIVFMGYDQYGTSKIGTTAGYNWLETTINKFIKTEEIKPEKIILALPFYTKLWKTKGDETVDSTVVLLKNINSQVTSGMNKKWLEDLKQNYIEYELGGYVYKMWVEDEESFSKKLDLVNGYNLAGAGYWRKGFESESVWKIVKEKLDL